MLRNTALPLLVSGYYDTTILLALTLFVGESPTLRGADRALRLGVLEWSKENRARSEPDPSGLRPRNDKAAGIMIDPAALPYNTLGCPGVHPSSTLATLYCFSPEAEPFSVTHNPLNPSAASPNERWLAVRVITSSATDIGSELSRKVT